MRLRAPNFGRSVLVATLGLLLAGPRAWAGAGDQALDAYLLDHFDQAFKTALPAAKKGDFMAQSVVAGIYYGGRGQPANKKAADDWERLALSRATPAAMAGDPRGQYVLGRVYCTGYVLPLDYHRCAAWCDKASAQGYAPAMIVVAGLLRRGWGVPKNEDKASMYYYAASKKGLAVAQYFLGRRFRMNTGTLTADPKGAMTFLRQAAVQGYTPAQFELADMYDRGEAGPADHKAAFGWYLKAAELGDGDAEAAVGDMYDEGRGVGADPAAALLWIRRSADKGRALGEFYLGRLYERGRGVAADPNEAAKWYRKSAELDYPEAQYALGAMVSSGRGAYKDPVEARKWLAKAAENGQPQARELLKRLDAEAARP
jgi:TPR repeat protein